MKITGLALFLALGIVVGCNPPATSEDQTKGGSTAASSTGSTPTTAGTDAMKPATTAGTADGVPTTAATKPGPSISEIPADLKTDAYEYRGLANSKPMDMEMSRSDNPTILTGALVTTLKSVSPDEAKFEVAYTGGLASLGDMELSLKKDGIRATSSSVKLTDDGYELPTGLTPGKTWKSKTQGSVEGRGTMETSQVIKVIGVQKVATKLTSYPEALLVVSSGPSIVEGKKGEMTSKSWYVKGKGLVKMQLELKQGKSTSTLVLQESAAK